MKIAGDDADVLKGGIVTGWAGCLRPLVRVVDNCVFRTKLPQLQLLLAKGQAATLDRWAWQCQQLP